MNKILLVEDNELIVKGLTYTLEQSNFEVYSAASVDVALNKVYNNVFDLIILDISLPDGSGFDICKEVKENYDVPIIFLTAKDSENDVVKGFNIGADDYVVKPFRNRELISRINNALRKYNKDEKELKIGNIKIDLEANRVFAKDKELMLTPLELKILIYLFQNKGKVISRDKILERIWDIAGNVVNDNTLTVYIKRIRQKLGDEDVIKTVKGIGYRADG
ncbi:MAG: response regulator transcription factor [Clostridia bacterium]|nr:response regulator transcription factor [Clostridia bacterium]